MKTAHRKQAHAKRQHRDSFALWKVIARSTGFNEAEQTACALPVRMAWSALKGGTANGDDIATLTDVIAICTVAGQNMDALVEETCEAARNAMCGIADRYNRCQRWGVDAAALRDIPPVLDFYEELLRVSTGGQMEAWLGHVRGTKARILYQVAA